MLLTKEVEVTWRNNTKKHYISKGYVYTKQNDIFIVKTEDLPASSHVNVRYKCDNCGKEMDVIYATYNRRLPHDDLCLSCSIKLKTVAKTRLSFDVVKELFVSKGYTLLSTEKDYKNNKSLLDYICQSESHGIRKITYADLHTGYGCRDCFVDRQLGEKSHMWRGGVMELSRYLRNSMTPWIQQQLQKANYTCELTGKQGTLNVHHMYSFRNIVDITMKELGMDIRVNISKYTEDELQLISVNFIKNNNLLANPKVLLESVHKEFHSFCGGYHSDTTQELWNSFVLQREVGDQS